MSSIGSGRYGFIGMAVVLMVAGVFIIGETLHEGGQGAIVQGPQQTGSQEPDPIRSEAGVFRGLKQPSRMAGMNPSAKREIWDYYARRAYPGAPPFVPHPVESDMKSQFNDCLGCHEKGGYVPAFESFAPITPHPEFANCRQCHVAKGDSELFVETDWEDVDPPKLGRSALPGGPPPIPHGLQLRENCAACHAGPAAIAQIRTSHPERVYCRQCHVPAETGQSYER